MEYLKRAPTTSAKNLQTVRAVVDELLGEIEAGGEDAVGAIARRLDGFEGDPRVGPEALDEAAAAADPQTCADIDAAHDRIARFAQAQRASIQPFELELEDGLIAGQSLIPVETAGCYIPGGRYAHIASALMSITTAREAGVPRVVACTPPRAGGIDPAMAYAMRRAGADEVLLLGGVQAIGAMAYGVYISSPCDLIAGPGNAYVAEAKRRLYGQVGIDMYAGPTEILIIADGTADPALVAEDLVSQAEHGPDSPAWLITLDRALGEDVARRVPERIAALPSPNREAARHAWTHHGEIALCTDREEAAAASDVYAAEHLEVMTEDLGWWHARLRNYGSLFLGPETTVSFGDKCSGPNHILPTRRAARHTGGLSVHKFLKKLTYQRMTPEASARIAPEAARLCRAEGMEGHAWAADIRTSPSGGDDDPHHG